MKTLILALAAVGILASSAMASDTIKVGGYPSICSKNPKSCGAGYDPFKKATRR